MPGEPQGPTSGATRAIQAGKVLDAPRASKSGQAHAAAESSAAEQAHMAMPPLLSLKQQKEALKENRIVGFSCASCKHERFTPMARCPACKSNDIATREFSRTGTVVSYTIQSVASEAFLNETPFAFAIVKLDDGPQVSGWVPWIAKPKDLGVGQKVEYVSSYKPGMQFEKR
jgi:uncharacterized OB-fold protein